METDNHFLRGSNNLDDLENLTHKSNEAVVTTSGESVVLVL